jgi:hypothetical protein
VENTKTIGLVEDIGGSNAAAWKEVGRLGLDININQDSGYKPTFRELAEHFRELELGDWDASSRDFCSQREPP